MAHAWKACWVKALEGSNPSSSAQIKYMVLATSTATISASTISVMDLINLSKDLAQVNAEYLGISVGIILTFSAIFSALFYLFNIKPFQEKIKKHEEQLDAEKRRNDERFSKLEIDVKKSQEEAKTKIKQLEQDSMKMINEKIDQVEERTREIKEMANKEIQNMRLRANFIELNSLWTEQYLWGIGSTQVYSNVLSSLISYFEKSIEYKYPLASPELCLQNISKALKDIQDKKALISKERGRELHDRLINVLSKLEGFDEQKQNVMKEAETLLSTDTD